MLVFEVLGANISRICKRMALTIEFLTPGTCRMNSLQKRLNCIQPCTASQIKDTRRE